MKRFRVGVIGTGAVTESLHLPVLREMREVDLRWAMDLDAARAARVARLFGIPASHTSLSDAEDVDAVLLATPVGARATALSTIADRGWNAFCEKPFAPTIADHDKLVATARKGNIRLGIGFVRRFYDCTMAAQRLIAAETFGPVEQVIASDAMWLHGSGRGADFYQASPQASGGGVLFETGSHLVDQTLTICGVESVHFDRVRQLRSEGLEFETHCRGAFTLLGGREVPFSLLVSRMTDAYSAIVIRCRDAEIRVGLAPESVVDVFEQDGSKVTTIGTPIKSFNAILLAARREWADFLTASTRSRSFDDAATGRLTTVFLETCYRLGTPQAQSSKELQ
jgi:predicted dehydrogenase